MTPEELQTARDSTVPDVVAGGLRVLFCGINPSLMTGATGHHFAHPGNRFWPVLHRSGFTPRQLKPAEQTELLRYGLGITNVVARATARADELSTEEFREGGQILAAKVERCDRGGWQSWGSLRTAPPSANEPPESVRRTTRSAAPASGPCPTPAA